MYAETREHADEHLDRFVADYQAKYPKAAPCLHTDRDRLLTYFDVPTAHWQHGRTMNVIESASATVRLRQWVTKGAASRTNGLLLTSKQFEIAQHR